MGFWDMLDSIDNALSRSLEKSYDDDDDDDDDLSEFERLQLAMEEIDKLAPKLVERVMNEHNINESNWERAAQNLAGALAEEVASDHHLRKGSVMPMCELAIRTRMYAAVEKQEEDRKKAAENSRREIEEKAQMAKNEASNKNEEARRAVAEAEKNTVNSMGNKRLNNTDTETDEYDD